MTGDALMCENKPTLHKVRVVPAEHLSIRSDSYHICPSGYLELSLDGTVVASFAHGRWDGVWVA